MVKNKYPVPSSFRDPSGFLFYEGNVLYRQVNKSYKKNYELLLNSNLYKKLTNQKLLIPHKEIKSISKENAYKIIKPEFVDFISYPYEWCFSQLKDAALTTLKIQKIAIESGMSLKDASAYNIQFKNGKPLLIDTLSFERYEEGKPWVAYKQFCQHFLAPLCLMAYKDVRLNQLLRIHIDGIPLDLTSSLLPNTTKFNFSLFSHIHLHSKMQIAHANDTSKNIRKLTKLALLALIDHLESTIKKLDKKFSKTEWGDYYDNTNYSSAAFRNKKEILNHFINEINPKKVWDLGGNTGIFSRISSNKGIPTISFDIDPVAVEKNYLEVIRKNEKNILPLILDLTNPSSGVGWDNKERMSLQERGPVDLVMGLALIHHLAISNNVPLIKIADFLSNICNFLIIEFIPKEDSKVKKLLATREDIFPGYNQENFENVFSERFDILESKKIKESCRTLYLMKKISHSLK